MFYDAASKFLCVELQVGYTATETIQSKLRFECQAMDVGVKVSSYHTDNGIYHSKEFLKELQAKGQGVKMSGVSAQFQNGAAESIIKGVVQTARTMMLHANLQWPEVADESLWPHALQDACDVLQSKNVILQDQDKIRVPVVKQSIPQDMPDCMDKIRLQATKQSHRVSSVPRSSIQREQMGKTEGAPTPDNQEAEAQVVQMWW